MFVFFIIDADVCNDALFFVVIVVQIFRSRNVIAVKENIYSECLALIKLSRLYLINF